MQTKDDKNGPRTVPEMPADAPDAGDSLSQSPGGGGRPHRLKTWNALC